MRVSKGKNKKLINAIENETEYIYMFKLNASNPIEKLLLSKVNSAMQEKNLTVRDAFLYVFSRSVEYGINSDTNIINENAANSINDNVNNNIITDKKEKKNLMMIMITIIHNQLFHQSFKDNLIILKISLLMKIKMIVVSQITLQQ